MEHPQFIQLFHNKYQPFQPLRTSVLIPKTITCPFNGWNRVADFPMETLLSVEHATLVSVGQPSLHWGQGPVYWAGMSQVYLKEMDSVPCMCPPGTSQIFSEFSLLVSL